MGRSLPRISTCEGNTLTCFSFVNQSLDASKSIPTKGCSPQTRTFGHKREPFMCITASRPAAFCLPEVTFGSHQPHTSGFCTMKPIRTHTSGQKCSSRSMHSPQTQFPALWGITAPALCSWSSSAYWAAARSPDCHHLGARRALKLSPPGCHQRCSNCHHLGATEGTQSFSVVLPKAGRVCGARG